LKLFFNVFIDRLKQSDEQNDDSEIPASIDKISQYNNEYLLEKPWNVNNPIERFERLQSNAELNSVERKKRRNDTLFVGKFLEEILKFKE